MLRSAGRDETLRGDWETWAMGSQSIGLGPVGDRCRYACAVLKLAKFLVFACALLAVLAFVVVPAVAGPVISSALRSAGLQSENVDVGVDLIGGGILSGRASVVHVRASDVAVSRAVIGQADLTLRDVSVSDQSFESISGTLTDVTLNHPTGASFVVDSVSIDGPSGAAEARGRMGKEQAEALVRQVSDDAGVELDEVTLEDGRIRLRQGGRTTEARLRVADSALILDHSDGDSEVLVAPAPSDPWRLRDVRVGRDGLELDVIVDAGSLAQQLRP